MHATQRLIDILDYWHKIEFFIPFGLDKQLGDLDNWQSRSLAAADLSGQAGKAWLEFRPKKGKIIKGFHLYLGIFDQSAITDICKHHLPASEDDAFGLYEEEERTALQGRTCFAKLPLTAEGVPLFDALSISTAPWALGRLQAYGASGLSHDVFEAAKEELKQLIKNFQTKRGERIGLPLGPDEVLRLCEMLHRWACFEPTGESAAAVLQAKAGPAPAHRPERSQDGATPESEPDPVTSEAEPETEEEDEPDTELDILNSFYIQDLERAMASLRKGEIPETLRQYLTPLKNQSRVDLYSEAGRSELLARLHPQHLNAGHWLADTNHAMSLMQQFAINVMQEKLQESGTFSVNGPPGTGKTTLLRDLFADNIVRRAGVLAELPSAGAAFDKSRSVKVTFKGEPNIWTIYPLIPELTGYEMVVASSNNAAVENISLDLPKRGSIGEQWRHVEYLQPVAHKLAAQNADGTLETLTEKDTPWGLICSALGNSRNRKKFCDRFFNSLDPSPLPGAPASIKDWAHAYTGPTFEEAKSAYHDANIAVIQALDERARYATLLGEINEGDEQLFCQAQQLAVAETTGMLEGTQQALEAKQLAVTRDEQHLAELREDERLIDRRKPSWWACLFGTTEARRHFAERTRNAAQQQDVNRALSETRKAIAALQTQLAAAKQMLDSRKKALQAREQQWALKIGERETFEMRLGKPVLPQNPAELEQPEFQINGLWHDNQLATLRSQLFAASLTLQQAWIAEASRKGVGLAATLIALEKLLRNRQMDDISHSLVIWQILFMLVPVVSTTFASFANQFRGLGASSIGWLYIDEAGQAVPQAAVGALWRAQRAVIVGDPLQIEPVFTLPSTLITALGRLSTHAQDERYAPNRTSVQTLADQANRFGTYSNNGDDPLWIGSPLRVHRRCVEPMFSLSNRIAYENKMIYGFGRPDADDGPPVHCESGWIDLPGTVSHKQVVPEQIEFVVQVVTRLYQRDGAMPALYVISPFKAVKVALQDALDAAWTRPDRPPALRKWMKSNIGTVHTFQGKEQDTVFMLLGADAQHAGGAQWAASKPNLLNVALTRAKRRCYLIGDFDLWHPLPFFNETGKGAWRMARFNKDQFLSRLDAGRAEHETPEATG